MPYTPRPPMQIKLTHQGLWSVRVDYDKVLEGMGDHQPQTPLVLVEEFILNALPEDIDLDESHYQVAFTLGSPFVNPAQSHILPVGDSLLNYGRSVSHASLALGRRGNWLRVAFVPNEDDRLSKIVAFVPASYSPQEAEDIAFRAVRPLLSQLSVIYQVPLETVLIEHFLFQPPNVIKYGRMLLYPYSPVQLEPVSVFNIQHLIEFDSFAAATNHYREGMNSWSPIHRFLSWFKAIESVLKLRKSICSKIKPTKFKPTFVANTASAQMLVPKCIGMKHSEMIDHFKPYRNSAAHAGSADDLELTHDLRNGLLSYYSLCVVANEVFQGLFSSTVEGSKMLAGKN